MITILVPLDGSRLAEEVLPCVENLASRLHAEVYFLQVVDTRPVVTEGYAAYPPAEEDVKTAEKYLSELAAAWLSRDIDAKWEVARGSPATAIVDFARSHKAYMIAMSTHGRSGLSRMVFGSVADEVLREAGIPVLLCKPGQKATRVSHTPGT